MKKHELLKHAYDNYQKGTEFKSATTGLTGISSGSFRLDGTGGVADCKSGMQIFSKIVGKWAEIVKPKIAVKVENEKEFKALMKYYDSIGYIGSGKSSTTYNPSHKAVEFKDGYTKFNPTYYHSKQDYQIIPFSEFAAEHNIKLPLLTSEDGIDLYEGDQLWHVMTNYMCLGSINPIKITSSEVAEISNSGTDKAFSTKQAALEWIEAQKPKEKEIWLFDKGNKAVISKDRIQLLKNGSIKMVLKPSDFEDILNESKSL